MIENRRWRKSGTRPLTIARIDACLCEKVFGGFGGVRERSRDPASAKPAPPHPEPLPSEGGGDAMPPRRPRTGLAYALTIVLTAATTVALTAAPVRAAQTIGYPAFSGPAVP